MAGVANNWDTTTNWAGGTTPAAANIAFFNLPNAAPVLSQNETVGQLTMRAGANGAALGGTYTTLLDLKFNLLVATNETQVLSAAGRRPGGALPSIDAGLAPQSVLNLVSTSGPGFLTTGKVNVGYYGATVASNFAPNSPADRQNLATLSIGKDVTVKVTKGGTAGDVLVGGATQGELKTVTGSTLTARNVSIGGVGIRFGSTTSEFDGRVQLTGSLTVGAGNGYAGQAQRADEAGNQYVPFFYLVLQDATVIVGTGGKATDTSVQIGDFSRGGIIVKGNVGGLTTVGKINVGSANSPLGSGGLEVESVVTSGGVFTINPNGTTTLYTGSTLDLEAGGTNKGLLQVEKRGVIRPRAGQILNKGVIKVAATAAAPTGDIVVQGDFAQQADGHLVLNLGGVGNSDDLAVTGLVTLDGAVDLSLLPGFNAGVGSHFTLVDNQGTSPTTGTFAGLPEGATVSLGGNTFTISYVGGTGNDVVLTETVASPSSQTVGGNISGTGTLGGLTVNLLNGTGALLTSTLTGSTGGYSFALVPTGTYSLQFVAPTGYIFSSAPTAPFTVSTGQSVVEPTATLVADPGPTAVADSGTTTQTASAAINVLGNDTNPSGSPLTITAVSTPAHGTVAIDDNGTPTDPTDDFVVYTPNAGTLGNDTFT